MRLTVTGGALGPRGTLAISSGVGVSLSGLLDNFLDGDGLLSLRSDGLQGSVERIADEREALDRRLASLEERYRLQFNALDSLLANIQSTGDFLTQQLANIPIPGQGTDN